jgi:DNA-binding FadR family transcriptional regulator
MNAAERIYQASTREEAGAAGLAERLARRIEDDIVSDGVPPGDALGSLQDLSRRYSVGRAATREAVGLLERRGLGRLRPGPCGGFIVSQPSENAIGIQLADYFRALGVTQRQLDDAREAVEALEGGAAFLPLTSCLDSLALDFAGTMDLGQRARERTLSGSLAGKLAAEILLDGAQGDRLGSEWELCERFGVGRLTVRQAICLLRDRGLVECRRGRGNGLVIRDRRATGATRLMLAYLIGNRLDVAAAGTMLFQLNRFIPALAIARADADQRAQLAALVERIETSDPIDRCDLLALVHFVSRLADSPIVDFFSRCLAAYEARFHPSLKERLPAGLQANYFRLMRDLLDRAPFAAGSQLEQAKSTSSLVMLEMSRSRPI